MALVLPLHVSTRERGGRPERNLRFDWCDYGSKRNGSLLVQVTPCARPRLATATPTCNRWCLVRRFDNRRDRWEVCPGILPAFWMRMRGHRLSSSTCKRRSLVFRLLDNGADRLTVFDLRSGRQIDYALTGSRSAPRVYGAKARKNTPRTNTNERRAKPRPPEAKVRQTCTVRPRKPGS